MGGQAPHHTEDREGNEKLYLLLTKLESDATKLKQKDLLEPVRALLAVRLLPCAQPDCLVCKPSSFLVAFERCIRQPSLPSGSHPSRSFVAAPPSSHREQKGGRREPRRGRGAVHRVASRARGALRFGVPVHCHYL